jgi:hypothetical protein
MLSRVRPVALALALLAALLGLPTPSGAAPSTPRTGQCHDLTLRQVARPTDTRRPVACSRAHDTQTVAVAQLPNLSGMSAADRADLGDRVCFTRVAAALGRTSVKRALSAYGYVFFFPTRAQIAAGAHWVRCDVVLQRGRGFARITHRLTRPILPRRLTDRTRACLTRGRLTTTCDEPHVFRSVKAFVVAGTAYPAEDELVAQGNARCPRRTDVFTTPSQAQWDRGQHTITCWDRTRK